MAYGILISIIASGLLNALILGVWKPWASSYANQKAKNLARKEDLDKILEEVKEVTRTQKAIESQLAGDLWQRQTNWQEKKRIYGDLLSSLHAYANSSGTLAVAIAAQKENDDEVRREKLITAMRQSMELFTELVRHRALAGIFLPPDAIAALDEVFDLQPDVQAGERMGQRSSEIGTVQDRLIVAARKDLGLD